MSDQLLDFAGKIYQASYAPGHWDAVMEELCERVNAHSGAIFLEDHQTRSRGILGAHGLPKPARVAYRFGLAKHDHTFQLQRREPLGSARQLIDAEAIRQEQPFYYRLVLKPHDIGFLAAMNVYNDDHWHVGIGLHRPFAAPPFSAGDCQLLQRLYPHLKQALRIYRELHSLRTRQHSLESALGRLMTGLILLGPDGRICYCSPVADTILAQHRGLIVNGKGRLHAYHAQEDRRLQALLDQLATAGQIPDSLAIGLNHPDQTQPLNLLLTTLEDSFTDGQPGSGCIALYLCRPHSSLRLPTERLRTLYGLTPAETGVAEALVNGWSVNQISAQHSVSVETVRCQLKSIYLKMGVRKQQDVIRTLLSGVIQVR